MESAQDYTTDEDVLRKLEYEINSAVSVTEDTIRKIDVISYNNNNHHDFSFQSIPEVRLEEEQHNVSFTRNTRVFDEEEEERERERLEKELEKDLEELHLNLSRELKQFGNGKDTNSQTAYFQTEHNIGNYIDNSSRLSKEDESESLFFASNDHHNQDESVVDRKNEGNQLSAHGLTQEFSEFNMDAFEESIQFNVSFISKKLSLPLTFFPPFTQISCRGLIELMCEFLPFLTLTYLIHYSKNHPI